MHAQFETIHPFDDGNGRTGRALVHVIFRRRGIAPRFLPPISVIFAGARDRYIAALSRFRFDENGVADWIEHFAAATVRAARLAQAYVTAVWRAPGAVARPAARDRYRTPRRRGGVGDYRSSTRAPEISAPVATAAAGRAKSRVYEGIEQLVSTGVLLPLSEGKRNR